MKNSEIGLSQYLLSELSNQLSLDHSARINAEHYLNDFRAQDILWEESKSRSIVRCAILAAYKSSKKRSGTDNDTPLTLFNLLSGPSSADIHTFIRKLKEFLKVVQIDERVNSDLQAVINSYAFSLTLYNKFDEVWEKLQINREDSKKIKDFSWIVFILSKINILQRRSDMIECACMLLGTFEVILSLLSKDCIQSVPSDTLGYLSSMIKAAPEQVKLSADHLRLMVEKFKEYNHLRGTHANSSSIDGILDPSHLPFNIKSLGSEYFNKILPDDIDERDFLLKETSIGSPLKTNDGVLPAQRFCIKNVFEYDDETLTMSTRFQDIKFPSLITNSPYSIKTFPPSSRTITTMELETWLSGHIEASPVSVPNEVTEKLDTTGTEFLKALVVEFTSIVALAFSSVGLSKPSKPAKTYLQIPASESKTNPDNVLRLFYKILLELLKNEEKQQELRSDSKEQMSNVLKNEVFYRALLVCCIETVLYVNNITVLEFCEVLERCKVSAFDTWKLMKNFLEFDTRLPTSLRQHFKGLEARVISNMAWAETSPVPAHIRMHLGSKKDLNHPAILMFCRRVLAYAALRIHDLSNLLNLAEGVREEIWNVMKSSLSEETDLFINREMDQIIICTIYGVCKAKNLNVTFNNLIAKYTEYYNDNGKIFRQARLEGNSTGDIIRFYNEIYVKYMKTYLMALSKNMQNPKPEPRIPSLSPSSRLRDSLPPAIISYSPGESRNGIASPLRSPYATPRRSPYATPRRQPYATQGGYKIGESPSYHLDAINSMMSKMRKYPFDENTNGTPVKKRKTEEPDYNFDIEDNPLEFADFKDHT
jgi:Retinoblastoma-associated protein B domain/Retinoblastoma-associated protein A domain/Domain of unknown function (DUF3452)